MKLLNLCLFLIFSLFFIYDSAGQPIIYKDHIKCEDETPREPYLDTIHTLAGNSNGDSRPGSELIAHVLNAVCQNHRVLYASLAVTNIKQLGQSPLVHCLVNVIKGNLRWRNL